MVYTFKVYTIAPKNLTYFSFSSIISIENKRKVKKVMTHLQFLEKIAARDVNDEVVEFATSQIEAMNARKANASAKRVAANEGIWNSVKDYISSEPKTAPTLLAEAEIDVTPQKLVAVLRPFVENGQLTKSTVKLNGHTYKAYSFAAE